MAIMRIFRAFLAFNTILSVTAQSFSPISKPEFRAEVDKAPTSASSFEHSSSWSEWWKTISGIEFVEKPNEEVDWDSIRQWLLAKITVEDEVAEPLINILRIWNYSVFGGLCVLLYAFLIPIVSLTYVFVFLLHAPFLWLAGYTNKTPVIRVPPKTDDPFDRHTRLVTATTVNTPYYWNLQKQQDHY